MTNAWPANNMGQRLSLARTAARTSGEDQVTSASRHGKLTWLAAPALLLSLTLLSACAKQVPTAVEVSAPGFLLGIWHGFIFPVAWFLSLFSSDIGIYAVPNSGGWYDFGYFIGIMFFGVGANRGRRVVIHKQVYRGANAHRDPPGVVIDQ